MVGWHPDLTRLLPPLIKNAREHFIFELGEPPEGEPLSAVALPLQLLTRDARNSFEAPSPGGTWPEVGSRMMMRMASGVDMNERGWIVVQPGTYRYAIHELRAVRMVLRDYLAFEAVWG